MPEEEDVWRRFPPDTFKWNIMLENMQNIGKMSAVNLRLLQFYSLYVFYQKRINDDFHVQMCM